MDVVTTFFPAEPPSCVSSRSITTLFFLAGGAGILVELTSMRDARGGGAGSWFVADAGISMVSDGIFLAVDASAGSLRAEAGSAELVRIDVAGDGDASPPGRAGATGAATC